MGGIEYIDRGPFVGDRWGRKRAVRVFRLFGNIQPEQIITNPEYITLTDGSSLPAYDSIWEGQKLEQYAVSQSGTLIEAVAIYTNDWYRPEVGVENITRTTEIPFAERVPTRTVNNVTVGSYVWRERKLNVQINAVRWSMKVRVDKDEYLVNAAYVADQKGKIHKITVGGTSGVSTPGGTAIYAQFDVGSVVQVTNSLMEVTYSWLTDPGVKTLPKPLPTSDEVATNPEDQIDLAWPGQTQLSMLPGDSWDYVRAPFTTLLMLRRPTPVGQFFEPKPHFRSFRPFVYDQNGPAGLPGYDATAFLPVTIPGPGGGG